MQVSPLEYIVIVGYLLVVIGMGFVFGRMNRGGDDFFRAGGRGTWWLIGVSVLMAGTSARSFTGNAGVAFEAGWSVLVIYLAGVLASLLHYFYFAARFRQTRKMTFPELIRERFGGVTEQVYAVLQVPLFLLTSGIWLWGLAIFVASAFGLPVPVTILGVGLVVLAASTAGGLWAVMATDFVQGLVMTAMAALLAVLSIHAVGGVGPLLEGMRALGEETAMIKPQGLFPGNVYTWEWAAAYIVFTVVVLCSMEGAPRYFAAKDGRAARRAAMLQAILMLALTFVFFIPAFAARQIYAADVQAATDLTKPAESAYAIVSRQLLPQGMLGLMAVAMFAATMSSMDTGLNRNAAIVVRNVLPGFMRLRGRGMPSDRAQLVLGRWITAFFGLATMALAWSYTNLQGIGVFEVSLELSAALGLPLAIPLLMGIIVKRTPGWSAIFSGLAALAPAAYAHGQAWLGGDPWPYHWKVFTVFPAGIVGFLLTMPFWRFASQAERQRIEQFFRQMATPVDFEKEVGAANDTAQLRLVGLSCLVMAAFVLLLLFGPGGWGRVGSVFWVAGCLGGVGAIFAVVARRRTRRASSSEQTTTR